MIKCFPYWLFTAATICHEVNQQLEHKPKYNINKNR